MSASTSVSEQSTAHHQPPSGQSTPEPGQTQRCKLAVLTAGGSGGFTALRTRLLGAGFEVREFFDFSEIVDRMPLWRPDSVVVDLGKVGMETLAQCELVRKSSDIQHFRDIPFVGYIPNRELVRGVSLEKMKIDDCIIDPCENEEIVFRICKAQEAAEHRRLHQSFEHYKMDLVEAIAHDVRSPLHTVSFALDLMLETESGSDPKFRKLLAASKTSTSQITEVMDMMLNIQRLEEGNASLTLSRIDVAKLVDRVLVRFNHPEAACHTIPAEVFVQADMFLLERIVTKIVKNCLRYVPEKEGSLDIYTEVTDEEVTLHFVDNASPIPAEHYERVFEMFARIPEEGARLGRSFGLDFAYCRAAVKGQKGSIRIGKDREGQNRFSVSFPRDW